MEQQKNHIHQKGGGESLDDGNDRGLLAGVLQSGQPELVADGESNEAQGNVTNEA